MPGIFTMIYSKYANSSARNNYLQGFRTGLAAVTSQYNLLILRDICPYSYLCYLRNAIFTGENTPGQSSAVQAGICKEQGKFLLKHTAPARHN